MRTSSAQPTMRVPCRCRAWVSAAARSRHAAHAAGSAARRGHTHASYSTREVHLARLVRGRLGVGVGREGREGGWGGRVGGWVGSGPLPLAFDLHTDPPSDRPARPGPTDRPTNRPTDRPTDPSSIHPASQPANQPASRTQTDSHEPTQQADIRTKSANKTTPDKIR